MMYTEVDSHKFLNGILNRDKQPFDWQEIAEIAMCHGRPIAAVDIDKKGSALLHDMWFLNGPEGVFVKVCDHPTDRGQWRMLAGNQGNTSMWQQGDFDDMPHDCQHIVLFLGNFIEGSRRRDRYGLYLMKDEDDWIWAAAIRSERVDYGSMYNWRYFRCDQIDGLIRYMREARPW